MTEVVVQTSPAESTSTIPTRRPPLIRMWRRLRHNRMAIIGAVMVLLAVLLAFFAGLISPYDYQTADFTAIFQPPSARHIFGTDALGRDMFTRILYGLRSACIVGFGAEAVELTLGLLIGAVAGYRGGLVDNILMRIVDIVYAFPSLLFAIVLVVIMGHSLIVILIAISATSWVGMARVVRSEVIKINQSGYVEAAHGMGARAWTIIRRYILPNSMGPIVVAVSFGIPANMMAEAGLSLIGLGIEPPTPDLGEMLSEASTNIFGSPYLLIFPALMFAVILLGFTFLGDGLRDVFDAKAKS